METRQKLEAEAGALRVLLQEFLTLSASEAGLPIAERRLCCPEFGDKVRAALAVTDAGKEVADRISGYQEQLKLNTRLIELLRDQRTSFMAQVNSFLEIIKSPANSFVENDAEQHVAMNVLRTIQFRFANLHAHRYADLLSMATKFELMGDWRNPFIAKFWGTPKGWFIAQDDESDPAVWRFDTECWDSNMWPSGRDAYVFSTLEAAFAYIEDHPAILGLQNVENAAKKVLDTVQPSR